MANIKTIEARDILDSRGNPTVWAKVMLDDGARGEFAVPAGASTGSHEAVELRDQDPGRFRGLGVQKAIENISKEIAPVLIGMDAARQAEIDQKMIELDGTPDKSRLGANAILAVSIACAKAAATSKGIETYAYLRTLSDIKSTQKVPYLFMNLINGGKHAASGLAFQEYHVVPMTDDVEEALNIGTTIQHRLKELIIAKLGPASANLGDEGGFAPAISDVRAPLEMLWSVVTELGHQDKVKLALDVAASSFFKDGMYSVDGKNLTADELAALYAGLIKDFPIFSIEDPFEEEAFADFAKLLVTHPDLKIVGDDLTTTNSARLQQAIDQHSINVILIKPNQIGTLTETLATMKLAREHDVDCIISHRSGETNDNFIADLAYAFGTLGLKAGAPQRGERVAKYNRLRYITQI